MIRRCRQRLKSVSGVLKVCMAILLLVLLYQTFHWNDDTSTKPELKLQSPRQAGFMQVDGKQLGPKQKPSSGQDSPEGTDQAETPPNMTAAAQKMPVVERLSLLSSRNGSGWFPQNCDPTVKLRQLPVPGTAGRLTFYVYNSTTEDTSATLKAEQGWYWEMAEIPKFLNLSRHLPLIDIGANLGLVTLQAAKQGRQVLAVEPVFQNALRLCRAVKDFGDPSLVRVVQNAVSSEEGPVTLFMSHPRKSTEYSLEKVGVSNTQSASAYAILLSRLVEVLSFKQAALKIDVEGHEGHVLASAERLFQQVDIPMVWLEWEQVKRNSHKEHGAPFIMGLMSRHHLHPYNLMTGQKLDSGQYMKWPFTVLWLRRSGVE